jgi:hypothetical protein
MEAIGKAGFLGDLLNRLIGKKQLLRCDRNAPRLYVLARSLTYTFMKAFPEVIRAPVATARELRIVDTRREMVFNVLNRRFQMLVIGA